MCCPSVVAMTWLIEISTRWWYPHPRLEPHPWPDWNVRFLGDDAVAAMAAWELNYAEHMEIRWRWRWHWHCSAGACAAGA